MLRHRLVLTYDALGDGVAADDVLARILGAVGAARHASRRREAVAGVSVARRVSRRRRARDRAPIRGALVEALDLVLARRAAGCCRASGARPAAATGTELAQIRPYQVGDDVRRLDAAASARTGVPHVRDDVPERALTPGCCSTCRRRWRSAPAPG